MSLIDEIEQALRKYSAHRKESPDGWRLIQYDEAATVVRPFIEKLESEVESAKRDLREEKDTVKHLSMLLDEATYALEAPGPCPDHASNACASWCIPCREGERGDDLRKRVVDKIGSLR